MLKIRYASKFKKDYKSVIKRGCNQDLLKEVLVLLCKEEKLPEKYKDHNLRGNYAGFRECHILPDWLLIYKVDKEMLTLILTRTGSRSDLF